MKFLKKYRLSSKADFQSVFDKPIKHTHHYLLMLYRANELGFPRIGIIINKSLAPKASDRNRMRRIIRESFREKASTLPNIDIIVMVRRNWEPDKLLFKQKIDKCWAAVNAQ